MTTVQLSVNPNNPSHTFMDSKPPLMPRQSTSDVLMFTHIIANRLAPGQNVWDYFSPAPVPTTTTTAASSTLQPPMDGATSPELSLSSNLPDFLPSSSSPTMTTTIASFRLFGNKRQSIVMDTKSLLPLPSSSSHSRYAPPKSPTTAPPASAALDSSVFTATASSSNMNIKNVTSRAQKRGSFAQSFRNSIYSLSQLISPSTNVLKNNGVSVTAQPDGPPHYNILVLGSDSAPLASTLYKMSSVLPSTNKVRHYQEISGFFVAYFRSDGSFTCSPKTSTEANRQSNSLRQSDENRDEDAEVRIGGHSESNGLEEIDQACGREEEEKEKRYSVTVQRSRPEGEAELLQLQPHLKTVSESLSSLRATPVAEGNALCQEPLSSATKEADMDDDSPSVDPSSNSNASLSVHAFSLDTTWPVPRMLAQAFWFPHAHGIIYIVDATRKNDPRGIDHLLNARQFLASLVMDPHFKRKDIPIVVFANKAGLNDETCFRVDEIADILGCEEWEDERDRIVLQVADLNDVSNEGTTARTMTTSGRSNIEAGAESRPVLRPWCVKSTRSDGEGEGLRESVEWLKSRMGEIWKST